MPDALSITQVVAVTTPMLFPKSSDENITWPALLPPQAAAVLAVQYQLHQSQWWPVDAIRAQQLRQLEQLLQYSRRHVPFYREQLKKINYKRSSCLAWDVWDTIPLLSRDTLQGLGKGLLSTAIPKQHGKPFEIQTSGSTGKPITVFGNDLTTFFWRAFNLREHLWHKRDFSGKLAAIRFVGENQAKAPNGLRQAGWGPSTDIVYKTGPCVVLDIKSSIGAQAEWLLREQPSYLLTHPTNLLALAEHFKHADNKPGALRELRTLSETMTPEIRKVCREVFGLKITDIYSTREVGYIALQCPEHEQYHVQSENVLVEILDDANRPCLPGEIGRVVVTSLHNFATPLIRYDLGDYAEVGEACPCGRGLPTLKRIMGRVRNMLTMPNGKQSWPVFSYKKLQEILPFRQLQGIQHTLTDIEIRLVSVQQANSQEEKRLTEILQESFGYPFRLRFTYPDEISRTKGGKYEEFISHVGKQST